VPYLEEERSAEHLRCKGYFRLPLYPGQEVSESIEERREGCLDCRDDCGCFCERFCCLFSQEFSCDFCSEVRDERREKKRRGCFNLFCCRNRRPREACEDVCCRACRKVCHELGWVNSREFCNCFCAGFCREFCQAFMEVRKRLACLREGRRAICLEGCQEISERICRRVCRRCCCLFRLD
jgi:hypothetical protein